MEFKNFKKDVEAAFNNMIAENLFVANVDKDLLWMGYLLSFEDETVRQDHNCNACKSFIRHYGKVVAIDPQTYKIKTFWDDVHTPENPDAGQLFKWNNNFAWVYNGSVADSFKEKVKAAGGNVDGFMRCSLHWFNYDDLDLHVTEPGGREIYYGSKTGYTGGTLDVDMNAGSGKTRDAVENIIWTDPSRLRPGDYVVRVHNFYKRESIDFGFEMEIEINGELHKFQYGKVVLSKEYIEVARIHVDGQRNISMTPTIKEGSTSFKSTNEWGIDTMKFQKVSCIMFSPNHWEGNAIGNKHLFFMIDGCKNPDPVRGFFNEYLRADLEKEHRRVFEALGSRAKAEYSDDQLSGLGFSSTSHNDVVVKVDNKSFKIIF